MANKTPAPLKVAQPPRMRKVLLIVLVVAVAGSGLFIWSQGYIVDIAEFFAFDPAGDVPVPSTLTLNVGPTLFERNSNPQVNAAIRNAPPNQRIYVFVERPDGTLLSDDGRNADLFTRYYPCPCDTNAEGSWQGGVVVPLKSEGQVGVYWVWASVGGIVSNRIPITVTHAGELPPPPRECAPPVPPRERRPPTARPRPWRWRAP